MAKVGFSTVFYYGSLWNPIYWEPSKLSKLAQLFGRRLKVSLQMTFDVYDSTHKQALLQHANHVI